MNFKIKHQNKINSVEPENTANTDVIKGLEGRAVAAEAYSKLSLPGSSISAREQSAKDAKSIKSLLKDPKTGRKYSDMHPAEQQRAEMTKNLSGVDITDENTGVTYRSLERTQGKGKRYVDPLRSEGSFHKNPKDYGRVTTGLNPYGKSDGGSGYMKYHEREVSKDYPTGVKPKMYDDDSWYLSRMDPKARKQYLKKQKKKNK